MALLRLLGLTKTPTRTAARPFLATCRFRYTTMTVEQTPLGGVPGFRSFKLAMIQLHPSGDDKSATLQHAREMLLKAATGEGDYEQPELLMLPVSPIAARAVLVGIAESQEYFNGPIANHAHKAFSELIPDVNAGSPVAQSELPKESDTLQVSPALPDPCTGHG